jgi:hypothetical protein
MRKAILRTREHQYRGYYVILGVLLIPATKRCDNKEDVKNILKIY